jgi:glycosyltransferase involved in cell wall biosynthesis
MTQRIIFDCERMKYYNTGLYHYCLQLGHHLQIHLDKEREDLTFFTPPAAMNDLGEDADHIRQHSLRKFYMPALKGFDIWHCTYQSSHYVPMRNRKIKVVLTIHDLNFIHEKKNELKKAKYLRHLQVNIDRSDVIICISDFCRRDVLQYCNVGNKPIHVIYNGTSTLKDPELLINSYKPERPFLFSLGVMCRKKNFHVLLPLLQQNDDLELLIAGRLDDTNYLNFIQESAREMHVEDNLRVLGNISEPEKSWYYQNCYAFALPSIAEGFGLPVTEAMSAGKPVFLSNRTALPEIGSDAAFYFRDFNATNMQQVFKQGMRRYQTGDMQPIIKQRSEQFCWSKAAREYLNVYRSLY